MASVKGTTRESFMENSTERAEQIVRVDATALLKTIRELEYKLTEQQRPDKPPPWAVALEQRIEQLENNFFQAQAKAPPSQDAAITGAVQESEPHAEPAPDHAHHDGETESPAHSPSKTQGGEHKEEEHQKRTVVDFATEMRVIGKVRKEIDSKFHTAELHLETKMGSFNLQLERLMKLLQIRPTTSELQTVMNAVYDVEKKMNNSMVEIKQDMRAQLKENLSQEIASIIEEVKSANNLSETGIKYIQNTVDGFANNLTDLREVTENTVVLMNESVERLKTHNNDLEDHVAKMKYQLDQQIREQAGELAALKADHQVLFEEFQEYRNRMDEEAVRLELKAAEEKEKFESEIARLDFELSESNAKIAANATELQIQQSKAESALAAQAQVNKAVNELLTEHTFKLEKLRKEVDALIAHDTPAKVSELQEELKKTNINVAACADSIEKYINGDLKTINIKVALLQEQCNIQIPNAYGEMSIRIDTLSEQLISSNNAIDKTMQRLQATDDTVGELMPLLDRVTALEVHKQDNVHEMASLKESLTSNIDTADELVRRLEEAEETLEGLESSVTNRMNQMRDALIDTILEKQSETANAMRNVRENLEVMARAGEAPVTTSAVAQLTAPGARPSASMQSSVSSKGSMANQSAKLNPPVTIAVPGQAQQAAPAQAAAPGPAAVVVPGAPAASPGPTQSAKVGAASASRKHSGAPAAAVGTRASVSSEMSESYAPDEYGDGFTSNISLASGSQAGLDVAMMQKSAVAAYQRPSMVGQEVRGGAPPTIVRQPSITSPPAGGGIAASVSRQPSERMAVSESAPSLGMQIPQPRLMSYGSPPPAQHANQNAYQNFDLDASPEPDGFSRTFSPDHLNQSSARDNHVSPRVPTVTAQKNVQQAPQAQPQAAYQAAYQAPAQAPVTYAQPAPVRPVPMVAQPQGQVRYMPPPQEQSVPKYQLHPAYQQQSSVMDGISPEDALYVPAEYQHFQQAQFLADLCLNFEEISVKRKRVAHVPTVMCESIADITQDIAEFMAKAADFEMVQYMLSSAAGLTSAQELSYDENLVLTKRNQKIEEYLASMTNLIILSTKNQQPGIVRMDARSLFVSLVKKSLDMFMSKHNQVLVVGNSRLGRVKIPSCLACDRPLIDKVRLDSAASRSGTRGAGDPFSQSQLSAQNPSAHLIQGLAGFNSNPSIASYGFGAPEGSSVLRESEEEEPPASPMPGTLAPIVQRKPGSAAANPRKRSALDGKLPEVQ